MCGVEYVSEGGGVAELGFSAYVGEAAFYYADGSVDVFVHGDCYSGDYCSGVVVDCGEDCGSGVGDEVGGEGLGASVGYADYVAAG